MLQWKIHFISGLFNINPDVHYNYLYVQRLFSVLIITSNCALIVFKWHTFVWNLISFICKITYAYFNLKCVCCILKILLFTNVWKNFILLVCFALQPVLCIKLDQCFLAFCIFLSLSVCTYITMEKMHIGSMLAMLVL